MGHLLLVDLAGVEALSHAAGEHIGDLAQVTHALQLLHLIQIVRKGQPVLAELFLQLFRLFFVVLLLGLLNEGEHIAHAQYPPGHAVGVEGLDHVQLFAGTHELDGLAGDGPDGQGSTAAGVAVQLGQQYAVDAQRVVKGLGGVDRVLAGHGVHHKEYLVGMDGGLDGLQLAHQRLVDMQTAGGVQKDDVVAVVSGVLHRLLGDGHRVDLPHLEDGDVQLLAHHLQLVDGGGTVHVAGGQQGAFPVLAAHKPRQLRAVGGLTGTLQAHHHHNGGTLGRGAQPGVGAAHERGQLLIDDLDDLLRRRQALQHIRAHALLGDGRHKVLDHLVADVRLQQSQPYLPHPLADVGLGQPSLAPQTLEYAVQFFTQSLKCHGSLLL